MKHKTHICTHKHTCTHVRVTSSLSFWKEKEEEEKEEEEVLVDGQMQGVERVYVCEW